MSIHPTQWSHGHQVHRQTISASSGQNELRKTRPNWSMLTKTILSNHMTSLSQYFQNILTLLQHFNDQCTNSNVQRLNSNIQCPKTKLLNFLKILLLLELDSKAAASCLFIFLQSLQKKNKNFVKQANSNFCD